MSTKIPKLLRVPPRAWKLLLAQLQITGQKQAARFKYVTFYCKRVYLFINNEKPEDALALALSVVGRDK